ncbi:MAG: hypothetical protein IPG22_06200 [Acidobacteria bacterium]|nr:hypothetical protein [Acidobacteriota bacterium]
MNPFLMERMDSPHLLAALETEGHLTPAEKELAKRLGDLVGEETAEEIESRLEKTYARVIEQSEFRAQLIQEVIALCDRPGSKKDLISAIKSALENSYVEL